MVFRTELTVVVEDGVVSSVEGLPNGWTYQVGCLERLNQQHLTNNNVAGFEIGIYKKEQTGA